MITKTLNVKNTSKCECWFADAFQFSQKGVSLEVLYLVEKKALLSNFLINKVEAQQWIVHKPFLSYSVIK